MIAAAGALAAVSPATAMPIHPAHTSHPAQPPIRGHPGIASHKCTAHGVAFVASAEFLSWATMQTGHGTWTGTITVHVTRSNHHAAGDRGRDVTYSLDSTKVTFGSHANPPAAGDSVHVIGKISELAKKCTQSVAPTTAVHKANIHATKHRLRLRPQRHRACRAMRFGTELRSQRMKRFVTVPILTIGLLLMTAGSAAALQSGRIGR